MLPPSVRGDGSSSPARKTRHQRWTKSRGLHKFGDQGLEGTFTEKSWPLLGTRHPLPSTQVRFRTFKLHVLRGGIQPWPRTPPRNSGFLPRLRVSGGKVEG
ncbi:unnamed protein product [Ascophyllum nodosum]